MMLSKILGVATVAVSFAVLSGAAFATDTQTALGMCKKNPRCQVFHSARGIGYEITVGSNTITCPESMTGQCTCLMCKVTDRTVDVLGPVWGGNVKVPPERSGGDKGKPSREKPEKKKDEAPAGGAGGGGGGGVIF